MPGKRKTRGRLFQELAGLRKKIARLEALETRRKQAEKALRETEQRYQDLFENAPDVIYTLSLDGKITSLNPTFETITGWSRPEMSGRHFKEIIHPEDLSSAAQRVRNILSGKKEAPVELRVRTKSGGYIIGEFLGTAHIVNGQVVGLFGIARDITARKRAEQALKYYSGLEKIISHLSSYFINISLDQMEPGINYALSEIGAFTGVDRAYLFFFSEDGGRMSNRYEWCAEGTEAQIQNLQNLQVASLSWVVAPLRRGEVFNLPCVKEFPIKSRAEKKFFKNKELQSLLCVPIRYGGKLIGFLGFDSLSSEKVWEENTILMLRLMGEILAGLLDRKRIEESLRESEEQYRLMFDSMSDMIHLLDRDFRFILLNTAFKRMNQELGLKTDVIGKTIFEVFPFLSRKVLKEYQRVLKTGKTLVTEEATRIGNRRFITETRKIPVLEKGRVARVITIIRDITVLKRTEAALQKSMRMIGGKP